MDIYSIIGTVLTLFSAIITYFLSSHLKSKSTANTLTTIKQITTDAINATEQLSKNTVMTSTQKKQTAMNFVSSALDDLGIKISPNTIDTMIESAVSLMNVNKPSKINTILSNASTTTIENTKAALNNPN
ncbi:MAG: phage holin [Candidatus Micrarchaeaceae archaeon]